MADARKEKDLTEKEIARKRDETLPRILRTPPKQHMDIAGKSGRKKKSKKTKNG